MKTSLRQRLTQYLRKQYPNWISKGDLERLVLTKTKYTSEHCNRRLREMESGKLSNGKTCEKVAVVDYRGKKNHAFYQALPPKSVTTFTNPSEGIDIKIPQY